MSLGKPLLCQGWHHLFLTSVRTHPSSQAVLTVTGLRALVVEVARAWGIADAVSAACSEPVADIEALRIGCLWHLRCLVLGAIAAESRANESDELWQLWLSAKATEAQWETSAALLLGRLLREHRMDQALGELADVDASLTRSTGGDA